MNGASTRDGTSRAPQPASDVLERALRYALRMTEPVTAELLALPTPCRGWDLRTLLLHAADSVSALAEGFDTGCIGLSEPGSYGPVTVVEAAADPAREFRLQAEGLLGMCARRGRPHGVVTIDGLPMGVELLTAAGALEVATHGWDIAHTGGGHDPIPAQLAIELLRAAPALITRADRDQLFAAPAPVASDASPSDRLAAYLGRRPCQASSEQLVSGGFRTSGTRRPRPTLP